MTEPRYRVVAFGHPKDGRNELETFTELGPALKRLNVYKRGAGFHGGFVKDLETGTGYFLPKRKPSQKS